MKKLKDNYAAILFIFLLIVMIVGMHYKNYDKKNPEQLTNSTVQLYQD